MNWKQIIWDPTPGGNVEHVEEHDLPTEDADYVLMNPESTGVSQSSGWPCVFGHVPNGRFIIVVYEAVDPETVLPVTAYEGP